MRAGRSTGLDPPSLAVCLRHQQHAVDAAWETKQGTDSDSWQPLPHSNEIFNVVRAFDYHPQAGREELETLNTNNKADCGREWVTCLCADVFGTGLAVAALALQGHAFTVPPTILGRRRRTASVPLPDPTSTLSITLRPLSPLWPVTINYKRGQGRMRLRKPLHQILEMWKTRPDIMFKEQTWTCARKTASTVELSSTTGPSW